MFRLTQTFVYTMGLAMYSGMYALHREGWMFAVAVAMGMALGYAQDRVITQAGVA